MHFTHSRLSNSSRREVQELVAIILDLGEELRHARLGPILPYQRENMAEHIRPE